jgi:hypothetical protein
MSFERGYLCIVHLIPNADSVQRRVVRDDTIPSPRSHPIGTISTPEVGLIVRLQPYFSSSICCSQQELL